MTRDTGLLREGTRATFTLRLRAVRVLGRRRVTEHVLAPATWVLAAFGLVLAFLLVSAFVRSVDSSGFDFSLHPLYEILYGIIGSAFGVTYVRQLFGDGPFALASLAAYAPMLLYLCFASIQRFGYERRSGVVDLVAAGPADVPSYLFSLGIADLMVLAAYLAVTGLFLGASAAVWNLAAGLTLVAYLLGLLFFAAALLGLALLVASIFRQPASAVALFLLIALALVFAEIASFAAPGGTPGSLAIAASWALRWLSPFYYVDLARMAVGSGETLRYFAALLGQAILCGAFVCGAYAAARSRGTR